MTKEQPIKIKIRRDFDSAWKYILQDLLKEFFEFFYPEYAKLIDWTIPYISMEQELKQVAPRSKKGKRIVDKLFRVTLKNGQSQVILVHIEIQGQYDEDCPARIASYQYRLHDHVDEEVFTVAIFTDDNIYWRPNYYRSEFWGCSIATEFQSIKLIDYLDRLEFLEQSDNPFAAVMYIHLCALQKGTIQNQLATKKMLVRHLFNKNFKKEWVYDLFRFLEWLFQLPKNLDKIYYKEVWQNNERSDQMFIPNYAIDTVKELATQKYREGIEKGIEKGIEEGIEKGIERGIKVGLLQGEAKLFIHTLKLKFKEVPSYLLKRIEQANEQQIMTWMNEIFHAKKIEEVF